MTNFPINLHDFCVHASLRSDALKAALSANVIRKHCIIMEGNKRVKENKRVKRNKRVKKS